LILSVSGPSECLFVSQAPKRKWKQSGRLKGVKNGRIKPIEKFICFHKWNWKLFFRTEWGSVFRFRFLFRFTFLEIWHCGNLIAGEKQRYMKYLWSRSRVLVVVNGNWMGMDISTLYVFSLPLSDFSETVQYLVCSYPAY